MSSVDEQLEQLRDRHHATARYDLIKSSIKPCKIEQIVDSDLDWDTGSREQDKLNAAQPQSFSRDVYWLRLIPGTGVKPAQRPGQE